MISILYSVETKTVKIGQCYMLCISVNSLLARYILLGKAGFLFLSLSLQGIPKGSANPTWLSPALALESPRAVGALSPLLSTPVLSATRTTFTQAHCLIMVREIRGTITAAGLEWNQLVKGGERGQNVFFLPFQRFTQKLYLKLFMTLRVQDT